VELPTALVTHFHPFSNSISLDGNGLDDALDASLVAFTADIEAAVPSYLGIQLTILQNGHPVTLTRITPHRTATTSLRIPLTVLGPRFDPDSRVTLYAATAGAFVDLAADLSYALHVPTSTDPSTDAGSSKGDDRRHGQVDGNRRITLDVDLPPNPPVSGVSGLSELSTINRAIGVLIGRGHHPDLAGHTLRRHAFREGLEPDRYAARLLGRDRARPLHRSTTSGGDARRQQPLPADLSSTDHRAFHRLDQRAGPPPRGDDRRVRHTHQS
jgi:hypothetical protein